jgi:FkbM family methyltransferase
MASSMSNTLTAKLGVESFSADIELEAQAVFGIAVNQWFKDGGDARFLEKQTLNSESIVVEVGGYTGVWSEKIQEKFYPRLFILEPVSAFYAQLQSKFQNAANVSVLKYGLGAPGEFEIAISDDGSSLHAGGPGAMKERIRVHEFQHFLDENRIDFIDLLQINIEGSEYDLMPQILASPILPKIKKIQIQYHLTVEGAVPKRKAIRERLAASHKEIFNYPFVWEAWEALPY